MILNLLSIWLCVCEIVTTITLTFHTSLYFSKLYKYLQTIFSKAKTKKLIFTNVCCAWDKPLQLKFCITTSFELMWFDVKSLSTTCLNLLGQFLLSIIFFGTRLHKDRTKRCFSGNLFCSFSTILLTIAAHSPLNFNFFVKLAWRDESMVLMAVLNLIDSSGKWFSCFCKCILGQE